MNESPTWEEAQGFRRLATRAAYPPGVYPCWKPGVGSYTCVLLDIFCLSSFRLLLVTFSWKILGNLTSNGFKVC